MPAGRAPLWEYPFAYGPAAPWTSGMAQAVAAQALARTGRASGDVGLLAAARRARRGLDGLLDERAEGPWVRLYSAGGPVVLNAQLQAALAVGDYATIARDRPAARLAERLRAAARALLLRFDTGFWSRYALDGPLASAHYHRYVAGLSCWSTGRRRAGASSARGRRCARRANRDGRCKPAPAVGRSGARSSS